MTDPDASPPPNPPVRALAAGRGSGERHSRTSYKAGESSAAAGFPASTSPDSTTLGHRSSDDARPSHLSAAGIDVGNESTRREARGSHRSHKHRSSGAFLLSDALDDAGPEHGRPLRRRTNAAEGQRAKSATNTPEKTLPTAHANGGPGPFTPPNPSTKQGSDTPATGRDGNENGKAVAGRLDTREAAEARPSPPRPVPAFDMESAQIVNMALNLSESRRLAAKRNVSQPNPPRLAPLPDSTVGGSLRQQLQQQRRSSRNISPKPERGSRLIPGARLSSPLQASFDPLQDGGAYRYHFSQSTLARAQKVKDHLELLTQYRRLLDLVPPLSPFVAGKASSVSPPSSPARPVQVEGAESVPPFGPPV